MTDTTFARDEHKQAIIEMQAHRGWIVNSFAQVEFMMADMVVRCRAFPEYAELSETLPYRLDTRVQRFEEIVEAPGPLEEYREELRKIVADFRESEPRRQFLVHGFASFNHTPHGDMAMRFDRYMPSRDEPERVQSMWFRPATLAELRQRATNAASFALDIFVMIHQRHGWVGLA